MVLDDEILSGIGTSSFACCQSGAGHSDRTRVDGGDGRDYLVALPRPSNQKCGAIRPLFSRRSHQAVIHRSRLAAGVTRILHVEGSDADEGQADSAGADGSDQPAVPADQVLRSSRRSAWPRWRRISARMTRSEIQDEHVEPLRPE